MRFVLIALALASACVQVGATTPDVVAFDFGAYHRCSLSKAGAVDCLSERDGNVFGQLGDGRKDTTGSPDPVRVIARGARKIVTGAFFSCALIADAVDCWGDIPVPKGDSRRPTRVIAHGVHDVAAGGRHACVLLDGGAVKCWGSNYEGESGSGPTTEPQRTPTTLVERGASAIAAGDDASCAVVDHALWCAGRTGTEPSGSGYPPYPLVKLIDAGVSDVALGDHHGCAIVDGALWCWGTNDHGQTGIGIALAHAKSAWEATSDHANGPMTDGAQTCFLGRGVEEHCRVPSPARILDHGVTRVVAKNDQTCAIVDGALRCWGQNAANQLGIASRQEDVLIPTQTIGAGVGFVATGSRTCALVDGAMRCSLPCPMFDVGPRCPENETGFDDHDLPFGPSEQRERLGVWRGTIGSKAIMVCLGGIGFDANYYYVGHWLGLPLHDTSGLAKTWAEGRDDGARHTWSLEPAVGNAMQGTWTSADGTRVLPIQLARVARMRDTDSFCAGYGETRSPWTTAYNAPRVEAATLVKSDLEGGLRKVSALGDAISIVELPQGTPGAEAFNTAQRRTLRYQIESYYDCKRTDPGGEYNDATSIELHNGRWAVTIESYETYCGGAHPSGGVAGYATWDLASGKTVIPQTWIKGAKSACDGTTACGAVIPDRLNALILAKATRNADGDECAQAVLENRTYLVRPSREGLVFGTSFAHVIQACDEDVTIPYAALAPFLNRTGKIAVDSLMSSRLDATQR